jgi:alkylation response protein AidB-like acyl-CoA dehydrogenase
MSFALTEDQEELRRVVRRFLEEKSPPSAVRAAIDSERGYDEKLWEQIGTELALPSLHIPEAYGGQGYSFVELAVVLEETGRALLCAPLFASVGLAANAILAAGSEEQRARLLPRIAAGEVLATAAITEPEASVVAADGDTLAGEARFVVDGHIADVAVVPAGGALWVVDLQADAVERQPLTTLDLTRRQAVLTFHGVPAERLSGEDSRAAFARGRDYAAICLAAEMAGGARACLDRSVAYAKERVQFGVPIGSFQAIKHQLAELLVKVEQATAVVYHAARAAAVGDPELPLVASIAKAYCSDVYTEVATETIQIHGGIGFTWEHDAHLHFRRARASEVMLGDATQHRERIAGMLVNVS